MLNTSRILKVTKTNVKRNKWLTISTIFVTAIVFTLSSLFISMSILTHKAVSYYEQKAQVIVFFKKGTSEADILTFRDNIYDANLIEDIQYVSQEGALNIYKEDFKDNPDLISTVTADSLPASLEIRANSIDSLLLVIEDINKAKETNASVDEVMYFKDVVENMRSLSRVINIGSVALISAMIVVTISLIRVTIGFNIKLHQEEIEIMHLVGSSDRFIRTPFLLEGTFYGLIGGLISALIILIPWYSIIIYTQGTDFAFWINQLLVDFNLPFLVQLNLAFILIYFLIHLIIGSTIGFLSSYSAVRKYLIEE
ncbi:MAG: permease-like cell division protein FtsX [Candidatus Dojkabacteria bacterium]|jgi:cell division transport system permease protein|nr:permease-like cell division protein FtsX [Candidatus Dojkabacteria bacterium]